MTSVFRDFDINKEERGHLGNINIYFVEDGILCVTVFGLNGGLRFAFMRVKYPSQTTLYDVCNHILDTITKDFKTITYEGYEDCMFIEKNGDVETDISKDHELLSILHPNINPPRFDFTRETVSYLKKYPMTYDFDVDIPETYTIIDGEVGPDGKFDYDIDALLHYDDDMEWAISEYETI
jgi:hypothetical protein